MRVTSTNGGPTGALPELGLITTPGTTPCPDLVGVPGIPWPPELPIAPIPDCEGKKGPAPGGPFCAPMGVAWTEFM